MFRALIAILAVTGFAASADAQPGKLPLSPGVAPGSPFGPGTQFLPFSRPNVVRPTYGIGTGARKPFPAQGFGVVVGGYFPYPNFGYGYNYGYGSGYNYGYGGSISPYDYGYRFGGASPFEYGFSPPPISLEAALGPPQRNVILANEFPATLSLQFPAPADVWFNGAAVKGEASEEHVLTSPVLKPGEQFAFEVKARWTLGGKTYESNRTVTLSSGDRSRLLVVSGTEVK